MRMKKNFRHRNLPVSVIIILGMLAAFAGVTAARYVMQRTSQGIVAAQDFYFTSDLLKEEAEKAFYYIDQKKPVIIHLYNSEDSLRKTPGEISYGVEVNGGGYTDSAGGTLTDSAGSGTANLVITPDDGVKTVTVTVTSSKPYQKVLTAELKMDKGNQAVIEDAKGKRAAVLTMTCTDGAKTITVTLPPGVIPDQTNDNVESYNTATGVCSFRSPGYGIYSLILLKSNADQTLLLGSGDTFAGSLDIISN